MICSQSQEEMFVSLLKFQHLHPNMGRIERHNSSRGLEENEAEEKLNTPQEHEEKRFKRRSNHFLCMCEISTTKPTMRNVSMH